MNNLNIVVGEIGFLAKYTAFHKYQHYIYAINAERSWNLCGVNTKHLFLSECLNN
ncbi:MAG: hypothetical protein H6Q13_65 [Bacteroidetes bacterium]|nr:hypothetical protein [Bacteroidota bacterium]